MTMKWAFSYNIFLKLSLYNITLITLSIHMDSKHSVIKVVKYPLKFEMM